MDSKLYLVWILIISLVTVQYVGCNRAEEHTDREEGKRSNRLETLDDKEIEDNDDDDEIFADQGEDDDKNVELTEDKMLSSAKTSADEEEDDDFDELQFEQQHDNNEHADEEDGADGMNTFEEDVALLEKDPDVRKDEIYDAEYQDEDEDKEVDNHYHQEITLSNDDDTTAADTLDGNYVNQVKSKLQSAMKIWNVPSRLAQLMAVFNKHMDILNCLPTIKNGAHCYKSRRCSLPKMKVFGKPFYAYLHVCTNPWVIKIDFSLPRSKWWLKLRYNPIVIPIDTRQNEGVTIIHSRTRAHAKFLGILRVAKAELQLDAFLRWDCRKPTNNHAVRAKYNMRAPNRKYNAIFYTFKVRFEVKRKRFWIAGGYRCWKCQTVSNKSGLLGYGPQSCVKDTVDYINRPTPPPPPPHRRRRRRRRRWWGKK